ncbi:MAG TPA: T9SS type A sorting domain-containing protein [Bacteroidia bacterium]|nr:T9SS type A sorting domain-containing protein [Bacteroidia bacterium]
MPYSYVCIDSVFLTLCSTGISEPDKTETLNIYPNPISDNLNLTVHNNELSEIILHDIPARKILNQSFTNSITINTEQLAKGIYLYEVRNKNDVVKKGKVVKN